MEMSRAGKAGAEVWVYSLSSEDMLAKDIRDILESFRSMSLDRDE